MIALARCVWNSRVAACVVAVYCGVCVMCVSVRVQDRDTVAVGAFRREEGEEKGQTWCGVHACMRQKNEPISERGPPYSMVFRLPSEA